jgi:hypothetical protein
LSKKNIIVVFFVSFVFRESMSAVGAVPAATRATGRLGHAGDGFPAALGKENRDLAFGVLAPTQGARDRCVGLVHRADGFEDFFAILADVFVDRHRLLTIYLILQIKDLNTQGTKDRKEETIKQVEDYFNPISG